MVADKELALAWRQLCRGPGIQRPHLRAHVAEPLAQASGITPIDGDKEARAKLLEQLADLAPALSNPNALLVRTALGVHPDYPFSTLQSRLGALNHKADRGSRTLMRRLDGALLLLAEHQLANATGKDPNQEDEWYLSYLSALLRFNGERLSLMETRRLTALRGGVRHIPIAWASARPSGTECHPGISVEITYGGQIDPDSVETSGALWKGTVRLPRELAAGETHEYLTSVEDLAIAQPYYLVTPTRRIDRFEARIKFSTDAVPQRIYRLDGVLARFAEAIPSDDYRLEVDSIGEVVATFTALRKGLSYGIRWAG